MYVYIYICVYTSIYTHTHTCTNILSASALDEREGIREWTPSDYRSCPLVGRIEEEV